MRSNGIFISASAQITFCTLDEVLRPQIFSMQFLPNSAVSPPHPEERCEAPRLEGWGGPMVRDALRAPHHEAGRDRTRCGLNCQSNLRASSGSMIGMPSRIG